MGQFSYLAGEIVLTFSALVLLLVGAFGTDRSVSFIRYASIAALLVFGVAGIIFNSTGSAFDGAFIADDFAHFVKFMIAIAAASALWFSRDYFKRKKLDQFEYSILMLFAVLGMGIMVSSGNLLSLYIGIEMQSLALYVMAAFNRDSLRASEAGLKYFVLGALSSGILLYGISLIYGFTGSLSYSEIAVYLSQTSGSSAALDTVNHGVSISHNGLIAGLVFVLSGLAFKISAAPFHMWTPDVYEGAPTPVTGFFAGAPKFAAMALITRLVVGPFGDIASSWQQVIVVLAVLSMLVGAFGALTQTNIKRLMAYSSIANMGYALVALAAGGPAGVKAMLVFMSIYLITIIGIFACILQMRTRDGMVEMISDLGGLSKSNKSLAIILSALMFSVAGIPFFTGFFGKWFAFAPAFGAGLTWLVILALLTSVVGAFYYLRIIKTIWFDDAAHTFVAAPRSLSILSFTSALLIFPILLLPFIASPILGVIENAAASLF